MGDTLFDLPPVREAKLVPVKAHQRRVTALKPTARKSDPPTSHIASKAVRARAPRDRDRVLAYLKEHGPATDFEIAEALGGQQTSLGVRRGELRRMGLVEATGERRASPSGSPAIVWRAT